MFIFKVFKALAKFGGKIADVYEDVLDYVDHVIHKKEYERRAKRRKLFWTILLSVVGGIIVVLLFPYKLIVKRNGDFEIRTLLLRVYRRSEDYDIPEGGNESFDIEEAVEAEDAIEA
ncbi:MAG: hypothetical protein J6B24_08680 [Clostridia bacterium]|nr:hypothetical protein [Clostridia bacterium]